MSLLHSFRRLIRSRDGNFAVFTGLAALPLVMALGGIVDANGFYSVADRAQDAAEAATLAAAKRLETGTLEDAEREAQLYGKARLIGETTPITLVNVIDQKAGTVTTTARGTYSPGFLKLAKIDSLPFERVAVASIKQKGYMDFQFLLDVSESMNIAASADDRKLLLATTKAKNNRPCAFACHEVEPGWSPMSVYQMNQEAGSNKARLRIDVLREAADAMIDKLLAKNAGPDSLLAIRVQTNGFGYAFQKGFGPDTDAGKLKSSIRNFSVANSHTSFSAALTGLATQLGTQGTGTQPTSIKKVALIITDGVKDETFTTTGLGPITPSLCSAIKSKGFDLAVLEIKYVEDYDYQGYFADRVARYYTQISPNLKSCASPGLYYLASDSLDAQAKLLSLAETLVTQALRVAK